MSAFSPGPWTASDTRVMASDGTLVCIMGVMSRVEDSQLICRVHDLMAFVNKFAAMRLCAEAKKECSLQSGPYCGTHDFFIDEDDILAARQLVAKAEGR